MMLPLCQTTTTITTNVKIMVTPSQKSCRAPYTNQDLKHVSEFVTRVTLYRRTYLWMVWEYFPEPESALLLAPLGRWCRRVLFAVETVHRCAVQWSRCGHDQPRTRGAQPDHQGIVYWCLDLQSVKQRDRSFEKRFLGTHTHSCFMALCPELPGWASMRRDIHPLTPETCCGSLSSFWISQGMGKIIEARVPTIWLNATWSRPSMPPPPHPPISRKV